MFKLEITTFNKCQQWAKEEHWDLVTVGFASAVKPKGKSWEVGGFTVALIHAKEKDRLIAQRWSDREYMDLEPNTDMPSYIFTPKYAARELELRGKLKGK